LKMSDLSAIAENLKSVRTRLNLACAKRRTDLEFAFLNPRLVAVSKTKPVECIVKAYEAGQMHFGENYIQELVDKASDPIIKESCPDIKWHFIGHLQRNKVAKLMTVRPNLFLVETVDSVRLAESLNDAVLKSNQESPLNIMVQVNISGEESKSGIPPGEVFEFVNTIMEKFSGLNFMGLMTIGEIQATSDKPNQDFESMYQLREKLCEQLQVARSRIELSMGMSGDFEEAVQIGSTNVRVGSTIFGGRQPKPNSPSS